MTQSSIMTPVREGRQPFLRTLTYAHWAQSLLQNREVAGLLMLKYGGVLLVSK